MKRTKIICTIGPSSSDEHTLEEMIKAGMNVARLNFSHGSHEQHLKVIQNIRELCTELNTHVAILQDLQGPKVRVGKFDGGSIEIEAGKTVTMPVITQMITIKKAKPKVVGFPLIAAVAFAKRVKLVLFCIFLLSHARSIFSEPFKRVK